MTVRRFFFLTLLLSLLQCQQRDATGSAAVSYLYVGASSSETPYRYGDLITPTSTDLRVNNLVTGRDTVLSNPTVAQRPSGPAFVALSGPSVPLSGTQLSARPYHYRVDSTDYWASFEPAFTGFPEYTLPDARDYVNRLVDWGGTAPGLEYSEYRVDTTAGRPIILLSERDRGRYVQTVAIVVDAAVGAEFEGRLYRSGNPLPHPIVFTPAASTTAGLDPDDFIDRVNAGYSRSYLLLPRPAAPTADTAKRLPRRALIDEGDLGAISASFLDDGTFMLLSDDHIVLQGSYVLDLDKGLLTITEEAGPVYRIFLEATPGISFTLPVSVVRLEGTVMQGYDNYLRIEVVQINEAR